MVFVVKLGCLVIGFNQFSKSKYKCTDIPSIHSLALLKVIKLEAMFKIAKWLLTGEAMNSVFTLFT